MPYEEDPSSFLFGLNQFASPPTESRNDNNRSTETDSMLAGLEAFASDDLGGPAQGDESAQMPNFHDQLSLWTNANFIFDGPTGHALIGDEEKEKEEAEHNRRREEENRRNEAEDRERMARNAAASSRGGNAARGKARELSAPADNNGPPYHQVNGHSQGPVNGAPSHHNPSPLAYLNGPSGPKSPQNSQAGFPGASQSQRPPQGPPINGQGVPSLPFFGGFPGFGQFGANNQHQSPPPGPVPGYPQLDMTSALAIQHLLASNPLALASLGQFAGFNNPQLQAHLASLAGANAPAFGQQPNAQAQSNGPSQVPSPWNPQSRQNSQSSTPGLPSNLPAHMPTNASHPTSAPGGSSSSAQGNASFTNPFTASVPGAAGAASAFNAPRGSNTAPASSSSSVDLTTLPSKKKRVSNSDGKKPSAGSDDQSEDDATKLEDLDRKYEIPPLKLIDTGNPEADAEANRLAIEEDKRRRNTAASGTWYQTRFPFASDFAC